MMILKIKTHHIKNIIQPTKEHSQPKTLLGVATVQIVAIQTRRKRKRKQLNKVFSKAFSTDSLKS